MALDPTNLSPLHSQIEAQVKLAIADERLGSGQRLPSVRAMAGVLGVHANTVSRAYAALVRDGVLTARTGSGTFVARTSGGPTLQAERQARLQSIVSRALVEALSLGFSPGEVEASFALRVARFRRKASPGRRPTAAAASRGPRIVVAGSHDLALDLLAGHLRGLAGLEMTSRHTGSLGGLIALARDEAHVAGCHLLDEESGEYNLPFVKRILAGVPAVVVNLAERIQGLLVRRGNPKGISTLDDLVRGDLTFINRQKGSGTRVLLDHLLRQRGLDPYRVRGYDVEVDTHMAVADAVASGRADLGLGILAAARAMDLDFLPQRTERYDLVVLRSSLNRPQVRALRRTVESAEFRDSVRNLGGYDTSRTGMVLADWTG